MNRPETSARCHFLPVPVMDEIIQKECNGDFIVKRTSCIREIRAGPVASLCVLLFEVTTSDQMGHCVCRRINMQQVWGVSSYLSCAGAHTETTFQSVRTNSRFSRAVCQKNLKWYFSLSGQPVLMHTCTQKPSVFIWRQETSGCACTLVHSLYIHNRYLRVWGHFPCGLSG